MPPQGVLVREHGDGDHVPGLHRGHGGEPAAGEVGQRHKEEVPHQSLPRAESASLREYPAPHGGGADPNAPTSSSSSSGDGNKWQWRSRGSPETGTYKGAIIAPIKKES